MKRILSFWRLVGVNFWQNSGTYRAAALAYTTLLAIVPLMLVSMTVLSMFPMFRRVIVPIQDFIFDNFVPSTGKVLQQYFSGFVDQASQLSIFGVIFLAIAALMMMFTVEQAMNQIWRVHRARRRIWAVLLYWGVLALAPILLALSFLLSSYLYTLPLLKAIGFFSNFIKIEIWHWLPMGLLFVLYTILYTLVPNCRVKFTDGLVGAGFATGLFLLAKLGFQVYLRQFHTYRLLYGAFAAIPIFLIWLYISWVIILLGGELAHALGLRRAKRRKS